MSLNYGKYCKEWICPELFIHAQQSLLTKVILKSLNIVEKCSKSKRKDLKETRELTKNGKIKVLVQSKQVEEDRILPVTSAKLQISLLKKALIFLKDIVFKEEIKKLGNYTVDVSFIMK
jgi:hypothetical protein